MTKPAAPGASNAPKPEGSPPPTEHSREPKAPRKPRVEYGFKPGAKITITEEFAKKTYRGKRLEYAERLKACDGKTVEDFVAACPKEDPPRGWLRFFVQDGSATLSGGKDPEVKPPKEDPKAGSSAPKDETKKPA